MDGVEGGEVRRQEDQPQERGRCHGDEDVPRLVEVLRQLPGEEAIDGADQDEDEVEGEWRDEPGDGQATEDLHVLLSDNLHSLERYWWGQYD